MHRTGPWLILSTSLLFLIAACGSSPRQICSSAADCLPCEHCIDGSCVYDESLRNACGQCSPEPEEVCDDGEDNDCDGDTDEGCDACEDIVCDDPPDNECIDGATLRAFRRPGTCADRLCAYPYEDITCPEGCADRACIGDPCAGVICDEPPSACFQDIGTCENGRCDYGFQDDAPCTDGSACTTDDTCQSGVCVGKPVTCVDPPDNECQDAETMRSYAAQGTCTLGGCQYPHQDVTCSQGCEDGACVDAPPCEGIVCDQPPNGCYRSTGTCQDDDRCHYDYLNGTACDDDDACTADDLCQDGACVGSLVTCTTPPDDVCMNDNTLRAYGASGTCADGDCDYPYEDVTCALGCADGTCVGDPCAGVDCNDPDPDACLNTTTLRDFSAPGTCSGGSCSYPYEDITCPLSCTADACVSCTSRDDCVGPTCLVCDAASGECVPPPAVCQGIQDCCVGYLCNFGTCILDDVDCETSADCRDPDLPVCLGGTCVAECIHDLDCLEAGQICVDNHCSSPAPCVFVAEPWSVDFGQVGMGIRETRTVRIRNMGSQTCYLWDTSMAAGSHSSFSSQGVPFPVPQIVAGAYHELEVYLEPDNPGTLTGQLEVDVGTNPVQTETVLVYLSGTGVAPHMCISPARLDFGTVTPGSHQDLTFDVTACGVVQLKVRGVSLDASGGDFAFAADPAAPFSIPGGESRTVTVRYSPADTSADFGRVVVSGNDPDQPTTFVELSGNYTGDCTSALACEPRELRFSDTDVGASRVRSVVCTNHGTDLRHVTMVDSLSADGVFTITPVGSVPTSVSPGETFHVEVVFTPTDASLHQTTLRVWSMSPAGGDCSEFNIVGIPMIASGQWSEAPACTAQRIYQPVVELEWPGGGISYPAWTQVFMTPAVINLTDDNGDGHIDADDTPDIVFNAFESFSDYQGVPAMLRAISGDDGHEIWTIGDPRFHTNYETQVAAGDVDGDGEPEVLASKLVMADTGGDFFGKFVRGNILCFEHDGTFKWESEAWHGSEDEIEDSSALGIADLDRDGQPEIYRGTSVFDRHGQLLWEGQAGRGSTGHGVFAQAVELGNGDSGMELLAGNTAYHADGSVMWQAEVEDGLSVAADFDEDGNPEVLLFTPGSGGGVFVLDESFGTVLSSLSPVGDVSALVPPVVADLDDQGGPEVGVIGTCDRPDSNECYWILDVSESDLAITVVWEKVLDELTLGCGSTAFDFAGDGPWDMVVADVTDLWVVAGLAHTQVFQADRHSLTGWELPVVADVDNDGQAEIVVVQNQDDGTSPQGILVYGAAGGDWVGTRRIWNQFGYQISNVHEDGGIPVVEDYAGRVFLANEPICQ